LNKPAEFGGTYAFCFCSAPAAALPFAVAFGVATDFIAAGGGMHGGKVDSPRFFAPDFDIFGA